MTKTTDTAYTLELVRSRLEQGEFLARLNTGLRIAVWVTSVWEGKVRYNWAMTTKRGECDVKDLIAF